jgi:putative glutamine amidotransferase
MKSRPVIGLPCAVVERPGSLPPVYAANPPYVHAIEAAGGFPVLLPLWQEPESVLLLRGRLDGLLLMGGGDVDPERYGEARHPETQPPEGARDRVEVELLRQALDDDLPLLGICRGIQVLNVVQGGTLVQHIPAQLPGALNHEMTVGHEDRRHPIAIEPDSRFASIVGATRHDVNSYHHQAVGTLGRDVRVVARTEDGVVEAMELPGRTFALAVQFHPERMVGDDPAMRRLFEAFVEACRERAEVAARASA